MSNFVIRDEVSFLYNAAYLCRESKRGYDGAWQIAPFQCSIPFENNCLLRLERLKERLAHAFPELIAFGERRAKKAFVDEVDTVTKPSYVRRLRNFCGKTNQFENMAAIASKEPASGGLVFSVFSPNDLLDRRRPGYVPCLVSGSLLLHAGELQLNAFFRSQSVIEFGIFDLMFLRSLQIEFLEKFKAQAEYKAAVVAGPLNLHFARILIHRRFIKNNVKFVPRSAIVDRWIAEVEHFMMETGF
jgi:hypothetical protein